MRLCRNHSTTPNRIRKYRIALGMTQRELARLLGVRQATISQWECGQACPSSKLLLQAAKILDTLAEALYPEFYAGPRR